MSTFTKRIDSDIRDLWDWYDTSTSTWNTDLTLGRLGWSSVVPTGVSLRFTGINLLQGTTINSAKITFTENGGATSAHIIMTITGVAEDNTAEFTQSPIDDARTRTHTSASVSWDQTITAADGVTFDSPNIGSIIQEIINRAGWNSGNAIAISILPNSSPDYVNPRDWNFFPSNAALLTIDYVGTTTSTSTTTTTSTSTSTTTTSTSITTTSTTTTFFPEKSGIFKIAKDKIDVLKTDNSKDLKISSTYGSLKYFRKQTASISIDISAGDTTGSTTIQHNLNYYPYVEVYMLNPNGKYEYCPGFNTGASTTWKYTYKVTKTTVQLYVETAGFTSPPTTQTFYFTVFIFKNNLGF